MPSLPLAVAYNSIDQYGEPARLINMYVETAETAEGMALRPRRALVRRYTIVSGPVYAMLFSEGSVGAAVYAISGTKACKDNAGLGDMTGSTGASIASSGDEVVFTLGGSAYVYNGTTFLRITDEDLPAVSCVIFCDGRFYYQQEDSDTWYFSDIYDASSIRGLAFATAETKPDATRGVAVCNNEVIFFGANSIEPHYSTGDPDAPLQLAQGRASDKGCAAQATICNVDNTLMWLGNTGQVFRLSNVPKVISTPAIDAMLEDCADLGLCTAFATFFGGHEFYVLTIYGKGTFAYDASTERWSKWETFGSETFRILSATMRDADAYLGDSITGTVYGWSNTAGLDDGETISYLFSSYLPTKYRGVPVDNVSLQTVVGEGAESGVDAYPLIEMRHSDDGRTWCDWVSASLGKQGHYDKSVTWWRRGRIGAKGRRFEFRMTMKVEFSASGMTFNEKSP